MEDTADLIYGRKAASLRELFVTAEGLHSRLRQFAEEHGIASACVSRSLGTTGVHERLTLYSCEEPSPPSCRKVAELISLQYTILLSV